MGRTVESQDVDGQLVAPAVAAEEPIESHERVAPATPTAIKTSGQDVIAAGAAGAEPSSTISTPTPAPARVAGTPAAAQAAPDKARAAESVPSASARQKARVRAESPRDAEEMRQLVEAERLLKSEPVRALRIVREGHVTFRAGYFGQERRYIEVMALFALGRRDEAHAQATWFLRDYPAGPYRHRVESEMLRLPVR
jgi:hypothetical protein